MRKRIGLLAPIVSSCLKYGMHAAELEAQAEALEADKLLYGA